MYRFVEIDATPEIPPQERAKALAWCEKFNRSWQDAKHFRRERIATYRSNMIEPLESRYLLSVTTPSINGIDPPVDNGSSGMEPNAVEGQGISGDFSFGTDHDDVDGGAAHYQIDYGDGSTSSGDPTSGTTPFGHTYTEEGGPYTLVVSVWDDSGYNTYNNTSWSGSSESSTVSILVGDADLAPQAQSDFTFEPNETWSGSLASFTDLGGADMADYTGTIDWGDGSSSSATFVGDSGVIYVSGSHNYTYQMDPDTGDVARPVSAYGEQADNPVHIDVQDDGGGKSVSFDLLAHAHLHNWIMIQDVNHPANNTFPGTQTSGNQAAIVHISIQAAGNMWGVGGTWNLDAIEEDPNDDETAIGAWKLTAATLMKAGAITGLNITVAPGRVRQTLTISWTSVTVGTEIALSVTDPVPLFPAKCKPGVVTLVFDP